MIISYDSCRYIIDQETLEQADVIKLPNDTVIEVSKWWPTKPPTPMLYTETNKPHTVEAKPAGYSDVKAFTGIKSKDKWLSMLKLQPHIEIYRSYELDDFMAHTHDALCQRIVSDLVQEPESWAMFTARDYEIVGFERPNWIHICAEFQLRTKFNAASKRRNRRSRIR